MTKQKSFIYIFFILFFLFIFGGSYVQKEENISITLCYNNEKVVWSDEAFSKTKVFTNLEKYQKYGLYKKGNRMKLIEEIVNMGFSYEDAFNFSFCGLKKVVDSFCKKINKEPVDATITFNARKDDMFVYTNEEIGFEVNKEELYKELFEKLKSLDNPSLTIKPNILKPKTTKKELIKSSQLLSRFQTNYKNSSENRKNNIKLATQNFNGMILKPHTEYSFNKTTGKRTQQKGYKEANIIVNDEYVEGFGGGVCQVSTTLYNALLLADINVIESHPHSLESSYIEKGFDAMVNFGSSDLRWKNEFDYPLYIKAVADDEKVVFEIFGYKQNFEIKRRFEIEKEISLNDVIIEDSNMFVGEEKYKTIAKKGHKVKSFLEYKQNGITIKKKMLRTQTYKAVQGVKFVGTKKKQVLFDENEDKSFVEWNTLQN